MSKLSNGLKIAGGLAAVVVIGLLIGWLGSSGRLPTGSQSAVKPPADPPADAPKPAPSHKQPSQGHVESGINQNPNPQPAPVTTPGAGTEVVTNWSEKVDEILTSSVEESNKAKQMLELFPRLPEEGQVEVARHLSNLLPDQDYPALGKIFVDPKTSEAVLEVLFGDALNRPNSVKLPMLVEVARQSEHPKAGEAKEILVLFLEENPGDDWNLWQARVEKWLKDNPD